MVKKSYSKRFTFQEKLYIKYLNVLIAFLILLIIFSLEYTNIIPLCNKLYNIVFYSNFNFALITVLLPTVITVLSLSISINKEKVYGLSLSTWLKLRNKSKNYNFLDMILISSFIILLYTFFYLFNAAWTLLILALLSFYLSVIFSIQTLPILTKDKKSFMKILKENFPNDNMIYHTHSYAFSNGNFDENYENINNIIIPFQNLLLDYGLKETYEFFKKRNDNDYNIKLINNFLILQDEFFSQIVRFAANSKPLFTISHGELAEEQNILSKIKTGYLNVIYILTNFSYLNYKNSYAITNSFLKIHNVVASNSSFLSMEKICLTPFIDKFITHDLSKEKENDNILTFILFLSIETLKKGETWFVEYLRDDLYSPFYLFYIDKKPLALFLCIFMINVLDCEQLNKNQKEQITQFLNAPSKCVNSYGRSWKDMLVDMLTYNNYPSKYVISLLNDLLQIYKLLPLGQYYIMNLSSSSNMLNDFSESSIIDAWLEIIMYSEQFEIYELKDEKLKEAIEKLTDSEKKSLYFILQENWFSQGKINSNHKLSFINKLIPNISNNEDSYNEIVTEFFREFVKDTKLDAIKEKINKDTKDPEVLESLEAAFISCLNKSNLIDENLDLSNEKDICFYLRVNKGDYKLAIDGYQEIISKSLKLSFINEIKDQIKAEKVKNHELTSEQIQKIENLDPDDMSVITIFNANSIIEKINQKKKRTYSNLLPGNLFFKEGSIRINARLNNKDCIIRPLNDGEIDYIIEHEYTEENGLYRFNEYSNDKYSILLTRDNLKDLLKQRIRFACLVFKQRIEIQKEKCLRFETKKDPS